MSPRAAVSDTSGPISAKRPHASRPDTVPAVIYLSQAAEIDALNKREIQQLADQLRDAQDKVGNHVGIQPYRA